MDIQSLEREWEIDKAICLEEEKLILIWFGWDFDPLCFQQDQILSKVQYQLSGFVKIYWVDIDKVSGFNELYELYDPCTMMIFFRNQRIKIDLGTGNNNKINFLISDKQVLIDILELAYRGCIWGKTQIVSTTKFDNKKGKRKDN